MSFKKLALVAVVLVTLVSGTNVFAAANCIGIPSAVMLVADGNLAVTIPGMNKYDMSRSPKADTSFHLCNINTDGLVTKQVCMMWFTQLTKAMSDQINVKLYYASTSDCEWNLGGYNASNYYPLYISLNK
ncbi:MAG: hypothetical protein HQK51_12235 [Oligoflexia bacterium]|nr:hypothetical protein [Oligoflexia bacterium]